MWTNVLISTRAEHAEALSEALMARGALSVSVEDADAGTDRETPQFGEPGSPATPLWCNSKVIALFEPAYDLAGIVAAAALDVGLDDLPDITLEDVAEENWVQLTQSQFDPIKIDDQLWIVPSWHMDKFSSGQFIAEQSEQKSSPLPVGKRSGEGRSNNDPKGSICLQMDPGMAFGTGSHPTTRLCLEWLLDAVQDGDSVLDYGCGSGILAIAAAKLGARDATGVEIDQQALVAAQRNAEQNQVRIDLRHSSLPLPETFDLVVANILTNPLCVLAPLLCGRLSENGRLALSGVLESQAAEVIAAYQPWIDLHVGATREGWCRLDGKQGTRR